MSQSGVALLVWVMVMTITQNGHTHAQKHHTHTHKHTHSDTRTRARAHKHTHMSPYCSSPHSMRLPALSRRSFSSKPLLKAMRWPARVRCVCMCVCTRVLMPVSVCGCVTSCVIVCETDGVLGAGGRDRQTIAFGIRQNTVAVEEDGV